MKETWGPDQIPNLSGRRAMVTGADRGLGLEITKMLISHGCAVTMAGNDRERTIAAAAILRTASPNAEIDIQFLDLSDLESVAEFARHYRQQHSTLDLLINNAGVMMLPYGQTKQGFERHFGINHLGHFALTGLLLPLIMATADSRVVTMSSNSHKIPGLTFDDVRGATAYKPHIAYGRSKLANLLFSQELARRLHASGDMSLSVAAHPGQSATNPQGRHGLRALIDRLIGQAPARGAQPAIRAATDPSAQQGDYYGPGGFLEMRGDPVRAKPAPAALDPVLAKALWQKSEEWTGVRFAMTP